MTTRHDPVNEPAQTLELVDELRQRITTLEVEVAHWERTCRTLSADLRALAARRRHCRHGRAAQADGGQST